MNLFASDLDQTLIYSNRWLKDNKFMVKRVEGDEKSFSSYMLEDAQNQLLELMSKYSFIPITTRTLKQFERIKFEKAPKIAVVANGAMILIEGKKDMVWDEHIQVQLKECEPIALIQKRLNKLLKISGVEKIKSADNYFLYMVTSVGVFNSDVLDPYRKELESVGWGIYNQGKKVYFIPKTITKGAALKYLIEKNHYGKVVAAGDSLLDESMGREANYFIVPEHSDLSSDYQCCQKGIGSGLEIIQKAFEFLEKPF